MDFDIDCTVDCASDPDSRANSFYGLAHNDVPPNVEGTSQILLHIWSIPPNHNCHGPDAQIPFQN